MTETSLWTDCVRYLSRTLSDQQLNTWIHPLQAQEDANTLRLLAPNNFVVDWVREHYLDQINEFLGHCNAGVEAVVEIGTAASKPEPVPATPEQPSTKKAPTAPEPASTPDGYGSSNSAAPKSPGRNSRLNPDFTFHNFVEGKSNQLARAAAQQVSDNPGYAYNPLLIYGGVGLGKTHLMNSVGNMLVERNPDAKVVYLSSERFVGDMVRALQHNSIAEFKRFYRSLDALLIDDIQFFAGKERSQEEFFHTFNSLLEDKQQIIMTCDRYPKEVQGLEERLKSRFGWGLTVAIEPPELETRVAILMRKAEQIGIDLPDEVAFFVAQRIHSNIRELEGALRRILANARFTGQAVTMEFTKEALRDLLHLQAKLVTIDSIQKTVADYFKLRTNDLLSAKRSRSIARPRQIAMSLAKELTSHSLPEIGTAFGGRDHTTVLHACRKVKELRLSDTKVEEDYNNLLRTLSA